MAGYGRATGLALTCALAALVASPARAQSSDQDKALALQLFDEGRALLASGKVDDACRKLEESRRLDPLPGTILNVAVCHEQQGRAASAVAEFREARALAERDKRGDRVALVDQHLKALEGKVPSLVIVVPTEADRPDLTITRDATAVGRAAWGTHIPVDPGTHVIEVSASGKKPKKIVLNVGAGGDVQTVTVAALEDEAPAVAPAPSTPPPAPAPPTPVAAPAEAPPPSHGLSTRRTVALVSLGAGVVSVGVGSYFGLSAISKHNDSSNVCTTTPCSPTSIAANGTAGTFADISTVSFAVGAVGLALGAILWLGDSGEAVGKAAIRVTPDVGWGRAGLAVGGGF